jgi:hypothetical protein
VIFWDADVVGRPEMLERLKRQLDLNLEASFAYSNFRLQISDCRINILKFAFCNLKSFESRRFNFEELKKNNFIHSTSLIRRKDAIKWDENLKRFQDWDLWLTMAEEGKIGVWIDEYLFIVLGGGRISTWFPSFAYRAPFKYLPWIRGQIKKHDQARDVVIKKHRLISGG